MGCAVGCRTENDLLLFAPSAAENNVLLSVAPWAPPSAAENETACYWLHHGLRHRRLGSKRFAIDCAMGCAIGGRKQNGLLLIAPWVSPSAAEHTTDFCRLHHESRPRKPNVKRHAIGCAIGGRNMPLIAPSIAPPAAGHEIAFILIARWVSLSTAANQTAFYWLLHGLRHWRPKTVRPAAGGAKGCAVGGRT